MAMASTVTIYRHGMSRVEACVALLLLVLLTALILPAILQARQSARRSECKNTLRLLALALQTFADYVGTAGIAPGVALLSRDSERAGVWAYDECRSLSDIKDGTSTTLLAIETTMSNGCWVAGGPATVWDDSNDEHPLGPGRQFGGLHNGGSMAVFVDGHVRFLAETMSPNVLSSAMTIAGSEPMARASVRKTITASE